MSANDDLSRYRRLKNCSDCGVSFWGGNPAYRCPSCQDVAAKKNKRQWESDNRGRVRSGNRESYQRNKDNRLKYQREYNSKNREKRTAQHREWRLKNPERRKAIALKWYRNNKHKVQEYSRLHKAELREWFKGYYEKNKEAYIHRGRLRRKKLATDPTSFTLQEWNWLKDIYNHTCYGCMKKEPEIKLTVDHKIPLSKGGNNALDNIQPLCWPCNRKKFTDSWFTSCPLTMKQNVGY